MQSLQVEVRIVAKPGCSPGAEFTRKGLDGGKQGSFATVVNGMCPEFVQ